MVPCLIILPGTTLNVNMCVLYMGLCNKINFLRDFRLYRCYLLIFAENLIFTDFKNQNFNNYTHNLTHINLYYFIILYIYTLGVIQSKYINSCYSKSEAYLLQSRL